jgi:hypothetical protein
VTSPLSGPSGRARATLAVFVVALGLAIGVRACRSTRARSGPPTGRAEWIWAPLGRTIEPLAFYVARDFDLVAPPASARLLAAADEEYVLYLNGRRVGAGWTAVGARPVLDAYEVAPLLRAGANRLVAELRSGRGAGGFLLRLADGGGRTLAETGPGWTVVRRYHPGLVRGWLPLSGPAAAERETAASWSRPPAGRWGAPREVVPRPLCPFDGGAPSAFQTAAIPAQPVLLAPGTVRIELGRVVEGYLALDVAPRQRRQVGLVLFAPKPAAEPPRTPMIVAPGAPVWINARPRSFRTAVVAGDLEVTGARIYPAAAAPAAPRELRMKGLFGLTPPLVRSPVEDEVGRELQRLWSGNAGGKAPAERSSG